MQKTLRKEDVHDSFINAEWQEVNDQNILKIGYDDFRYVMFIDCKTDVEYLEKITRDIFNKLTKNSSNIENDILELKNMHFSDIYKIK